MIFDAESLHALIRENLGEMQLIVVANREPFIHQYSHGKIEVRRPASGMASALHPVLMASGGTWIGHGSGDADRATVDEHDRVAVPPEAPCYTLRRVWLTEEQEFAFYHGMSNSGIWPLCLITFHRPRFDPADWEGYREVNQIFADAVLDEVGSGPACVFIQDYHFSLLPRMLKNANPRLVIGQFWHIPWPNREVFRTFPWGEELLDGLLGNDLLGFHIHYHCQNFLDTVDRTIEARVDPDRYEVLRGGRSTLIRPFPISIDSAEQERVSSSAALEDVMARFRVEYGLEGSFVGLGIERLDISKGIPERLRAIDLLLETRPEYRGRLRFIQVAVPSRLVLRAYQDLSEEVESLVDGINDRWKTDDWYPISYLPTHHTPLQMSAFHRLADFCLVSSLHDGMNLVAKEFVASRVDDDGVLILSRFTGSSRELVDAIPINPFSILEIADAIHTALTMPETERRRRMRRMREHVRRNNVYKWASKIFSHLLRIDPIDSEESN
ncbi:MAG: trehalose-6-phosphate synthase [Isosphaeraceae bacterium]|nr:trehalose-6-phosphate synthase [Isosphaeraceae bacterium]